MASVKPSVSFIGLGAMGFGMAANLVKEGYPVTGFDLYGPTLDRFKQAGGSTATKPTEAVASSLHCVCMVATAQQAQDVILDNENAAIKTLPQGAVLYLCSTVPCAYVQDLEKQLAARGRGDIYLIDCPVSGGAARAANGTLSIMAGGSDAAITKGRDILQVMADPAKLYIVAGGIGAGSNMKMVHQVLAANQILAASEAIGFASYLDLDLPIVAGKIVQTEGWSWMLENRLPRMLDENHLPLASALTIILKDTSIITSEARRCRFPTPMTSTAEQVYFTGLGRGFGPDDDSGLIRLYTEGKGRIGAIASTTLTEDARLKLVVDLLKGIHVCSTIEALAFAHSVSLDLDQVFDLCINAAGGSSVLSSYGPEVIRTLRGGSGDEDLGFAKQESGFLQSVMQGLLAAIDEAQRLKTSVFLGSAALNILQSALRASSDSGQGLDRRSLIETWVR
ncbi:hypothetical protein NW762_010185 [Fusarium torreyae]|uniref:3-hydroxyisobutyrate dehydrogenase n=1 Tax=Fusarium torreyae TaxID=1237075 RepID=A0A9W8RRR1_9HYPO|nr:hypothetical protein NW762_010185 [Fusarium torreyae]